MEHMDTAWRSRLYHLGTGVSISDIGFINYPEEVSIEHGAHIDDGYWFNVVTPGLGTSPKIIIRENVRCGPDVILSAINRIEVGNHVVLGSQVYISDTDHQFREIGIPIGLQGVTSRHNRVFIGDYTWIGANSVIVGQVTIGRNSRIAPNTVVTKDIPDNCFATGVPASITSIQ